MANKPWQLDRRSFLRGTGVSLGLPLMEGMSWAANASTAPELPRRLCVFYFPFGVTLKGEWAWFPEGEGTDFQFSKVLSPLEALRDEVTVINGLSHPNGHAMPGHDTGDILLTGASLKAPDFANTVSLDQVVANQIGGQTRFPSLTMSSDGGVGEASRTRTLSFTRKGRPIPALSDPQHIFMRLFGVMNAQQRKRLERSGSMLDRVLDDARSFQRRLGKHDQDKFDEYLTSVRAVEESVERSKQWLDVARPEVDPASVNLEVTPAQPAEYLRSMYDLTYLALKTDSTRVTTYQIGQNLGAAFSANVLPKAVGLSNWHGLGHGAQKKSDRMGKMQTWLTEEFTRFLTRLKETPEGESNLLDRTTVLYGSTNDSTHGNRNYPLVLAGGRGLGFRHGQYLHFEGGRLSNLFTTMLDKLGVPAESFADSTGMVTEVVA